MNEWLIKIKSLVVETSDAEGFQEQVGHIYIYLRVLEHRFNKSDSAPYQSLCGCLIELAEKDKEEIQKNLPHYCDTLRMIVEKFCRHFEDDETLGNKGLWQRASDLN